MTTTGDEVEPERDREIVTSRVIDGPRPLVFGAWTEPRHLARWFGPRGFTTATRRFDFRPGGEWEFDLVAPDGTAYPNLIRWRELVAPERIVYEQGTRADDPDRFETTVTFTERAGRTEVTLRTLFRTRAFRDFVAANYRAVEGAQETLARLGDHVGELATSAPGTLDDAGAQSPTHDTR